MQCILPEPKFYKVKLGYGGVNLFFVFVLRNIDFGFSLDPPRRSGSNVYPQFMVWIKKYKKKIGIPLLTPVLVYKIVI